MNAQQMFASATSALQHNDFFDLGSRIRIDPRRPTVYATGQHLTERRQLVSVHRITPSHLKRQTCILRASAEEEEIEEEVADGWPLLLVGQSGLRQVAERVPDSMLGSGELIEIVADLLDILRETAGTSLAAPQIGIPLQVVVLEETEDALKALPAEERLDRKPFGPITLVNPKLIPVGRSGARHYEGCLCMPECSAMVERYTVVDVTAVSPMGDSIVMRATDWQARALQHAADHLKGLRYSTPCHWPPSMEHITPHVTHHQLLQPLTDSTSCKSQSIAISYSFLLAQRHQRAKRCVGDINMGLKLISHGSAYCTESVPQ